MTQTHDWQPAHEIADAVRRGERKAIELLDEALAVIERLDPIVNAWVELEPPPPDTTGNSASLSLGSSSTAPAGDGPGDEPGPADLPPPPIPDGLRQFYVELRQLFTGIQVAGPTLTPASIDKGFQAIPAVRSSAPTVPACFYDPGDYTCVKDAVPMWWDPEAPRPGGTYSGCWRMPEGGLRYFAGDFPSGNLDAQRDPEADPCTAFAGVYFT